MKRFVGNYLNKWKLSESRKPLIIRGARQIGKTTCVEHFSRSFKTYVGLNFERMQPLHALFEGDLDPKQLVIDLQVLTKQEITPGDTLLFLDEIQACPRALLSLRYFYEMMPELHVIAAGSLLDFAIENIGIGVGRVNFLYMYPMSFKEFLYAMDETHLIEAIIKHEIDRPCNSAIHEKALRLLGEYIGVGGGCLRLLHHGVIIKIIKHALKFIMI